MPSLSAILHYCNYNKMDIEINLPATIEITLPYHIDLISKIEKLKFLVYLAIETYLKLIYQKDVRNILSLRTSIQMHFKRITLKLLKRTVELFSQGLIHSPPVYGPAKIPPPPPKKKNKQKKTNKQKQTGFEIWILSQVDPSRHPDWQNVLTKTGRYF